MEVNFYSNLRHITGTSSKFYRIDGNQSLLDLLKLLVIDYPGFQTLFFDSNGTLDSNMPVFLNGRNPRLLPEGLNTRIKPADILSLFTPIASGKMNVEVLLKADQSNTILESTNED